VGIEDIVKVRKLARFPSGPRIIKLIMEATLELLIRVAL